MSKLLIGKRLAMLRDELARPGEDMWTQGRVAAETGLTLNQVARLEQSGAGSIDAFVTLLLFYHQRGYNLSWVILPDNSVTSKLVLSDTTRAFDAHQVLTKLDELKITLVRDVEQLADCLSS